VLWHCWLGDRNGIRPVKRWVLVCWRWQFDWRFARLTAPVVTITSIIISSNKVKSGDILVSADPGPPGKWPLKRRQRKTAARQVTNRIPTGDLTSLTWSNLLEKRPAKWKPKAVKHYCMEWVLLTYLPAAVGRDQTSAQCICRSDCCYHSSPYERYRMPPTAGLPGQTHIKLR